MTEFYYVVFEDARRVHVFDTPVEAYAYHKAHEGCQVWRQYADETGHYCMVRWLQEKVLMKILLKDDTYIENVICILPLEPDDWLITLAYSRHIGGGQSVNEIHLDPAFVVKIQE